MFVPFDEKICSNVCKDGQKALMNLVIMGVIQPDGEDFNVSFDYDDYAEFVNAHIISVDN